MGESLRLLSYEELKKKREKARKAKSKMTKRPTLKGSVRKSITHTASMKTRTQSALSRGVGGMKAEGFVIRETLASNDLVHTILKEIAPLNLPDQEFTKAVVVLLWWVLVGVEDFFMGLELSEDDLSNLRQGFASSFNLTRIVKPVIDDGMWSWSLSGSGDRVADCVVEVLSRVSVSQAMFPETCGFVIRKAIESLANTAVGSPRVIEAVFNSFLGSFIEGTLWGNEQ